MPPQRDFTKATIQTIQRGGMPAVIATDMTNAVTAGVLAAGKQIKNDFARKLFKAIDLNLIPATRLRHANRTLAEGAQAAIVGGWHEALPAKAPIYRRGPDPNKNRLSQLLGPALASESMLRGTTDRTISFINASYLNTEARHWYRVNYGAYGPKVSPRRPEAFPVTVQGHTLFHLEDKHRPAPNSWLPRAFVSEGTEYFEPKKGPADVHGGGTRSAVFTDLGFRHIAEHFYPTYGVMFNDYINERGVKTRLRAAGVRVISRTGQRPTVNG